METAAGRPASGQDGVRDIASLGEITAAMLRETFPEWRVFEHGNGAWLAARAGAQKLHGPESLIQRVLAAPDLTALAEKLCLQEYLDGLGEVELDAVWRDMRLPGADR